MFNQSASRTARTPAPHQSKTVLLVAGGMLFTAAIAGLGLSAAHATQQPVVAALASWCAAGAGVAALAVGIGLVIYGGMLPADLAGPQPTGPYPVSLDAHLDEPLNRWTWLVKWFLLIPHVVILPFLWVAFGILTLVAFVSIAANGRYPAVLFGTNAGILRWTSRVAFYGYSALATDSYPPFTLRDVEYPIRLGFAYPQHLSRRLVWVKSWLLAIPHYAIIAVFSGSTPGQVGGNAPGPRTTGGLVPLLVLFAAIALLFTGRYPRGIFDLLMGLHRWILRVFTYVALMHDAYPPFRVDLGGEESPPATSAAIPARV